MHGVSKIVQITDCHLFGDGDGTLLGINTRDSFNAVLQLVKEHSADADLILVTGDISQDNSIASYAFCQHSLETLGIPFVWLYGNHDEPEKLAQTPFAANFPKRYSWMTGRCYSYTARSRAPSTANWLTASWPGYLRLWQPLLSDQR